MWTNIINYLCITMLLIPLVCAGDTTVVIGQPTTATVPPIARVQFKSEFQSGFSSDTLAFPSNVTAGNSLILGINIDQSANTVSSVTDTQSNTWSLISALTNGVNRTVYLYWVQNANAGATTITVTYSGASSATLSAGEFSGISAVDTTIAGANGSTNPINPGNITPTVNNTMVVGCGGTSANAGPFTPGTGLAQVDGTSPPARLCLAYEVLSGGAGVAQNTDCTMTTVRNWSGIAATFAP